MRNGWIARRPWRGCWRGRRTHCLPRIQRPHPGLGSVRWFPGPMFRQPPGLSRNLIKNRYDIDFAKHWPVPVGLRFPSKTVLRMTCRAVASGPLLVRQLRDAHILLPRWGRALGRNQLWVDPGRGLSGADRTIPRQFDRTLFGRGQDSHAEIAEPGAEIAEKNFIKPLAEHRLSERWHGRGNFSACSAHPSAISA